MGQTEWASLPLGASDHSASEKKAGWRKSLDKSPADRHTKSSRRKESNDEQKNRGLTDKQRRAIEIGAAAVATALVAYGSYKLVKSGKLDRQIAAGKAYVDELLGTKTGGSEFAQQKISDLLGQNAAPKAANQIAGGIRKLAQPESLGETLKRVNPHFGDSTYENNCTLCSIASFLRQRGFDVTAGNTGGKPQNLGGVIEDCFKNVKVFDGSAIKFGRSRQDAAEMLLKRFGQNAEGVCSVQWRNSAGRGHAFNWSIKDGVVSFFDAQQGWGDSQVSNIFWRMIDPNGSLQIARLDNTEIDLDALKKYISTN